MQNSDNTHRTTIAGLGRETSAPVIDPAQPHTCSPHLRWCERPDGTVVLESAGRRGTLAEGVWQEVALWREAPKPVDYPNIGKLS